MPSQGFAGISMEMNSPALGRGEPSGSKYHLFILLASPNATSLIPAGNVSWGLPHGTLEGVP